MDTCNWIGLFGVIGGLGAFLTGFFRYLRTQKWKRAEFVAKEVKEFESKPAIMMVMRMLDWELRTYELYPENKPGRQRVWVSDDTLCAALISHGDKQKFSKKEARVRDIFDQFLDGLEKFEHFIQSGLVNHEEFRPYLIYWIEIIGDKSKNRKPERFYEVFWRYIDFYGYHGVQNLFMRYGYDIHPREKE